MNDQAVDSTARTGGCSKVLGYGCLIVILMGVILGAVVWTQWRGWTADSLRSVAEEMIKRSDLPDAQSTRIRERINGLAEDFENGDVSTTQFGLAMGLLMQGPFFVKIFHDEVVTRSGLSDDEKAEASLTLQRFARGVSEGSISTTDLQESASGAKNQKPSDDDIRAIIAECKTKADNAGIPEEPHEIDVAGSVDRAIERALKEGASAPPPVAEDGG